MSSTIFTMYVAMYVAFHRKSNAVYRFCKSCIVMEIHICSYYNMNSVYKPGFSCWVTYIATYVCLTTKHSTSKSEELVVKFVSLV